MKMCTFKAMLKQIAFVAVLGTAAVVYTGCGKDYDDDFKKMEEKVDGNQTDLQQLLQDRVSQINAQLATLETAHKEMVDGAKKEAISTAADALKGARDEFAANVADLQGKIDANKGEIDSKLAAEINNLKTYTDSEILKIAAQIAVIDASLDQLDGRTAKLENGVEALNEKLALANKAIDELKADLKALPADIDAAKKEAIQTALDELTKVKNQTATDIARVETDLAALLVKVDKNASDAEAARSVLAGQIATLNTNLTAEINSVNATLGARIDGLQTKYGELVDKISAIDTKYLNLSAELTNLQAQYSIDKAAIEARLDAADAETARIYSELSATITAKETALKKEIADLNTALLSQASLFDSKLDAQYTKITSEYKAALQTIQDQVTALAAKVTTLEGAVENLKAYDRIIEGNIANLKTALETAIANGDKTNADAITAAIAEFEAFKATYASEKSVLEQSIATLKQTLEQADAANKAELEAKIDAAVADLATLQATVTAEQTKLTGAISRIDGIDVQITTINTNISGLTADLGTLQADLTALTGRVSTLEGQVASLQSDLASAQTDITNLQNSKADQTALDAAISNMNTIKADLEAADAALKTTQDSCINVIKNFKDSVYVAFEGINTALASDYYKKADIDTKVTDLQTAIDAANTQISELSGALTPRVNQMSADISAMSARFDKIKELMASEDAKLKALIDAVSSRIQSVAYIPEYADGKVMVSSLGGNAGKASFQFKVTPVAASADIVTAFAATPADFTVDVRDAKVRSGSTASLKVSAIEEVEPGVVKVTADPSGMIVGSVYKAALNIKLLNGTDLTSDYFTIEPTTINENLISFNYTGQLAAGVTFVLQPSATITGFSSGSTSLGIIFNTLNEDGSFATPQSLDFEVTGVDFAAYGLDASKVTIVPEIVSVYSWITDNKLIAPVSDGSSSISVANCLTFNADGKIIPVPQNPVLNADMSIYKCVVKLQAQYNGTNVGTPKYTCVKFQKPVL